MLKNEYQNLLIDHRDNGVVVITMNRPDVANAFNTQTGHDLKNCFSALVEQAREYRCVVLTGAGDKAFCAGADLKERNTLTDEQWVLQHEVFERAFKAILDCPVPVIAAVNGAAYAGGMEIMLQCDFTYASTTARFALTEVSLGIMPGGGGTQLLPRIIGERETRAVRGVGEVALQHDLQAARVGRAVHRRDHRHRAIEDGLEGALEDLVLQHPLVVGEGVALLQVGAGAKRLVARAGQHHAAILARLFHQSTETVLQVVPGLGVEGIGDLGAVHGDHHHAVVAVLDEQVWVFVFQHVG